MTDLPSQDQTPDGDARNWVVRSGCERGNGDYVARVDPPPGWPLRFTWGAQYLALRMSKAVAWERAAALTAQGIPTRAVRIGKRAAPVFGTFGMGDVCGAAYEPVGGSYKRFVCTLEKGHNGPMHVSVCGALGSAQWPIEPATEVG